jgi:hypothetical protein
MSVLLINQKVCNKEISRSKKKSGALCPRAGGKGLDCFSKKTPITEEIFFNTTKRLRVWQIPYLLRTGQILSPSCNHELDVKAWLLDQQFLLFTQATSKAKHLIISAHGGYFPTSSIIPIPQNTELVALGPHGWSLLDPSTDIIAQGRILPYASITESGALPAEPNIYKNTVEANVIAMAGTSTQGYIRNYSLSKFQSVKDGGESYYDIVRVVAGSGSQEDYPEPVDILTVRNRKRNRGKRDLKTLFKTLQQYEIQYDKITLSFCRSNSLKVLLPTKFNPCYTPALSTLKCTEKSV